jgi:hypothetical protein
MKLWVIFFSTRADRLECCEAHKRVVIDRDKRQENIMMKFPRRSKRARTSVNGYEGPITVKSQGIDTSALMSCARRQSTHPNGKYSSTAPHRSECFSHEDLVETQACVAEQASAAAGNVSPAMDQRRDNHGTGHGEGERSINRFKKLSRKHDGL